MRALMIASKMLLNSAEGIVIELNYRSRAIVIELSNRDKNNSHISKHVGCAKLGNMRQ